MQRNYDLDSPYSIGSKDYRTLKKHIDNVFPTGPGSILELGSGTSTFQLARDYPATRLYSLESDRAIQEKNQHEVSKKEAHSTVSIIYAPIRLQMYQGVFLCYDFSGLPHDSIFDVLIVDGPVERLYPKGRESALYFLFDRLHVGALIALDDYHRETAERAVRNWLNVFADTLETVESTSSFVVLRKVGHQTNARNLGLGPIVKSYWTVLVVALLRMRSALSRVLRRR